MIKYIIRLAPWFLALAAIALALLCCEDHLLWKLQEHNLFLASSIFFHEQMLVPGGWLSWAGSFLTQFFYYPLIGVLLLCGWWWLLMWLLKRAFQLPDQWSSVLLVPVGLLLLTIVDMGYWVYVLKLQGHAFVATMGATAVAALLWAFRVLPNRFGMRPLLIGITCALGYPLLGIYALAAALLMGIWSWRLKQMAWLNSLIAVVGVIAVPLICYRTIFYQTNLANIYYAALPLFYVTEEYHAYYLPYYLLAAFFLLLTIVPVKPIKPLKAYIAQGVLTVALLTGVVWFWYKDDNFHRELAMQHSIEQQDWQQVLKEASAQEDEPTRAIVMMKNLALARLGRQGDDMYNYPNGSKRYEAPFDMRLMLVVGPLMYYQYGMTNYCMRLSTEMGVEFGWRMENLKLLAKCAILNGEQQHALKYIGLLRQTTFGKEWADKAQQLMGDSAAIVRDAEMGFITHMMHYPSRLSSDKGNIERFLMETLAMGVFTNDALYQEQSLLASLWTKDIQQFWVHFQNYLKLHPKERIPRYYQEAAYLYAMIEGREGIDRIPLDASVKQSFDQFMQYASRYENADVEVAREGLRFFRHTYYYDYYLMSQLPEY